MNQIQILGMWLILTSVPLLATDIVSDSKFRIDFDSSFANEAWANWIYSPIRQDYDGKIAPPLFLYHTNVGYRKANVPQLADVVVTIVFVGEPEGESINQQTAKAYRSRLHLGEIDRFLQSISSLVGAFYEDGKIYVVGKRHEGNTGSRLYPEDVVVIIRAVCNTRFRGARAEIASSQQGSASPQYGEVKFEGMLENTRVGQVLFEADRILKSVSLGCDNIHKKPIRIDYEWYQNKFDFKKLGRWKSSQVRQEEWHRFWFVVEDMRICVDKKVRAIRFDSEDITVRAQRTRVGANGREFYFDDDTKSSLAQFAAHFSENFHHYRREFPVLNEMVEMAKLVAIVRWLFENGVIIKLDNTGIDAFYNRYTPIRTPIIRVSKTRMYKKIGLRTYEVRELEMSSVGGVDIRNFHFTKKRLSRFVDSAKEKGEYVVFRLL